MLGIFANNFDYVVDHALLIFTYDSIRFQGLITLVVPDQHLASLSPPDHTLFHLEGSIDHLKPLEAFYDVPQNL